MRLSSQRNMKKHKALTLTLCALVVIYLLFRQIPKREDRAFIDVEIWTKQKSVSCEGNFIGYGHEFARLTDITVDPEKPGEFGISCETALPKYSFLYGKEGTHLSDWMDKLYKQTSSSDVEVHQQTTIAVRRYEAHNLYHTMTDWYNVFLICKLLNLNPKTVDILLVDGRPKGLMDSTWGTLFGHVFKIRDLKKTLVFKDLIWNILGYESPVNFHKLRELPFADEFYNFFIGSFGVESVKKLDCSKLRISIIWRRDYISHPERKEVTGGLIHRKFKNEDEILNVTKETFQGHHVDSYILEEMQMQKQINVFTETDVLIGMHGAGMAHTLFLPGHAAVFEMFPNYWGYLHHFKAFSRWRGIHYTSWRNEDEKNEFPDFYTYIPPDIVRSYLTSIRNHLCSIKSEKE